MITYMSRRFQFSLRALIITLTAACLWLGWTVEQARRRGAAIDAILAVGGEVYYELGAPMLDDRFYDEPHAAHFWPDLRSLPVEIILPEDVELDAVIASYLEQAAPVQKLVVGYAIQDEALPQLHRLNDGCIVTLLDPQYISAEGITGLKRARPQLNINK